MESRNPIAGWTEKPFEFLVRTVTEHPGKVLAVFGVFLVAAVLLTGMIRFEQDVFRAFPQDTRGLRVLVHALRSSASHDRLYLLVSASGASEDLPGSAQNLVQELRAIQIGGRPAFESVSCRKTGAVTSRDFEEMVTAYLRNPETFLAYEDIPRLEAYLQSPEALEQELKRSLALLSAPGAEGRTRVVALDPFNFRRFLAEKLQIMNQGLSFAPGPFLFSLDGEFALIIARPSREAASGAGAAEVLETVETVRGRHPELRIGITGGYAIAAAEERLIRGDILACLGGSALAIAGLFLVVYRNLAVMAFIFLPLGAGIQLALGFLGIFSDRIHLLAAAFSTVVLGLGIDFAIHVYDRYRTERRAGVDVRLSTERAVRGTGAAVLVGACTTMTAFLVLAVTGNPLLRQIGWLVSLGLFFCLLTILWVLPAWMVWLERRGRGLRGPVMPLAMDKLGRWVRKRPKSALFLSFVLFAAAAPGVFLLRVEHDPAALKPRGLEAVEVQEQLLEAFGTGRDYALVAYPADGKDDLWRQGRILDERLENLKEEGLVESWASISRLSSSGPLSVKALPLRATDRLLQEYGLDLADFPLARRFLEKVTSPVHGGGGEAEADCARFDKLPPGMERFVMCSEKEILGSAWVQLEAGREASELRRTLGGQGGNFTVISPKLAAEEIAREIRRELSVTVTFAAVLVIFLLAVFFRRLNAVVYALLPMTLGLLTTAGLMGWAGIHLNLFNFVVLPLLIGIGLDDGIHIVRRYSETGDIEGTLATTGRSILVTTLTTVCGFGSLALARYHVLEGMGLMAIFGIVACFVYSVLVLPGLLAVSGPPASGRLKRGAPR